MIRDLIKFVRGNGALIFVAVVYLWSAVAILSYRKAQTPPGVTIELRIGHWQLEAGVRDAFEKMAAEYHTLHPEVSIVQDAIPEGSYGTWMTTQLMGGTAPDMMEIGLGVPYNIQLAYLSRYFLPLTTYLNQPNPYNRGTNLEGDPWRKTYKDAMRGNYQQELKEYMTVPLSQFGIRIFYNRDLFRKLTGLAKAPPDYRSFLEACRTIRSRKDERGLPYTPIAGSGYHVGMWDAFMCNPLTYGALRRADFNRDGNVGCDELFVAFKTGLLGFDFPPFQAKFRMLRELTDQFQPGFTGLGRDEAVMLFAQQHAVFITTGTWDFGSLVEQARGVFDVGVMDFPMPTPDDPEFGRVVEGPAFERPQSSFSFAITRKCKHPEVALDFLRFLGSQPGNQELNRIVGWIPAIQGATLPPMLRAFEPRLDGIWPAMPIDSLGGETTVKWGQMYSLFQVDQIDYTKMASEFLPFYLEHGVQELNEFNRNTHRGTAGVEQMLAGKQERAREASGVEALSEWIKYRQLTAGQLLVRNLDAGVLQKRLQDGVVTNATGPYEFNPELIGRVRNHLHAQEKEHQ